ncbi:hypothetical protein HDU84_002078 [Entophlyctis sp. JEL0112]|nr:hypothetical protein HDU84_002078 [Entophlyctis sp. JEL0112]
MATDTAFLSAKVASAGFGLLFNGALVASNAAYAHELAPPSFFMFWTSVFDLVFDCNTLTLAVALLESGDVQDYLPGGAKALSCQIHGSITILSAFIFLMIIQEVNIKPYSAAGFVIAAAIFSSLVAVTPFILNIAGSTYVLRNSHTYCLVAWPKALAYTLISFGLVSAAAVVIVYSYAKIYIRVRTVNRKMQIETTSLSQNGSASCKATYGIRKRDSNKEQELLVQCLIIVGAYFVGWLPYCGVIFWEVVTGREAPACVDFAAELFFSTTEMLNPLLVLAYDGPIHKNASRWLAQRRDRSDGAAELTEEIARIRGLLPSPDLYRVLGLARSPAPSDADIKRAYRKLALLLHPDKCADDGCDDAFKAVAHSYAVLSDPDKRSQYDLLGVDPDSAEGKAFRPPSHGTGPAFVPGGFAEKLTPRVVFDLFFADAPHVNGSRLVSFTFWTSLIVNSDADIEFLAGPYYRRLFKHTAFAKSKKTPIPKYVHMLQLIPLALLALHTVINIFSGVYGLIWTRDRSSGFGAFSWGLAPEFSSDRKTSFNGVRYYVNPDMFEKYFATDSKSLLKFESQIESQHYKTLVYRCLQEENHREYLFKNTKTSLFASSDNTSVKAFDSFQMESCESLKQWKI